MVKMKGRSLVFPDTTLKRRLLKCRYGAVPVLSVLLLLSACNSDTDTNNTDTGGDGGDQSTQQTDAVVSLPQVDEIEPEPIDWTPPEGDSYEDSLVAYDQARESKIGEHPGYAFAGDIWERMATEGHPPSQYHLALLHYFGNGSREFNHNLTGEYIRKSAASGYPLAHAFMAMQNENGDGALFLKNDETALENWQKAADGGHCGSIKRLKRIYTDGELGASADPARVAELETKESDCTAR